MRVSHGLAALGIRLSQPPLRAPVLAQHTLGYVFSAKPQDRSSYFKALLEVTDLDEFRSQVAALEKEIALPENSLLGKLALAASIPAAAQQLKAYLLKVPSEAELTASLSAAFNLALAVRPPDRCEERREFKRLRVSPNALNP